MLERLVLEGIDREAGDYPSEGETLKDWLPESVIKEMKPKPVAVEDYLRTWRRPFLLRPAQDGTWWCAQRPYDDVRDETTDCRPSG